MAADDRPDPNRSGSRWEPDPASPPAGSEEPTTAPPGTGSPRTPDPAPQDPAAPPAPDAQAAAPRRRRTIGIPVAAGVATGLVVASGLGGFALGVATSDDVMQVSDGRGTGGVPPFFDGRDGHGHEFPGTPPDLDGDELSDLDDDGSGADQGSDGSGADQESGGTT
jgi:hypothetical protein